MDVTTIARRQTDGAKDAVHEAAAKVFSEVRSAWRFRWYGASAAWIGFLIGWGWLAMQPNIYEASARVYIDSTSVLRPILDDQIVAVDVAAQLNYVRQSLLGRENLERVARGNALDVSATTPAAFERVLDNLRSAVTIANRDRTAPIYTINYRNSDSQKAIGVVSSLLNTFLEDTIGANQQGSDTASRFLDARIAEYEQRLQQAETALAEFKKQHADRLPGTAGDYFQRMGLAKDGFEAAQKALRLAESKRAQIREQLQSESPMLPANMGIATEPAPNSIDARIRSYQAQLDSLLLQFTERHPDVVNLRETLARLQEQRTQQLAALGVIDTGQEISNLDTNPVYQALRIALSEADVEVATVEADVAERRAEVRTLQGLIDDVPDVEAELARLNRDYDVIYNQYQGLVQSRETQDLSAKVMSADEVEFRVIDPPRAPFEPVAPNRLLLLGAVFAASLGIGGALCWLLAQLNPVFANVKALREATGLPVIGTISEAAPDRQRRRRRVMLLGFAGVMSTLAALFLVAIVVETRGPGIFRLVGLA